MGYPDVSYLSVLLFFKGSSPDILIIWHILAGKSMFLCSWTMLGNSMTGFSFRFHIGHLKNQAWLNRKIWWNIPHWDYMTSFMENKIKRFYPIPTPWYEISNYFTGSIFNLKETARKMLTTVACIFSHRPIQWSRTRDPRQISDHRAIKKIMYPWSAC